MKFVRALFYLSAVILSVLTVATLNRSSSLEGMNAWYLVYAVLMFGDAVAMALCAVFMDRKKKMIFWFAVFLLTLNIVLTIFDQFGWADLIFVLLNVVTLMVLLFHRREILPQ